jgi:hypothetical protein
MLGRRLASLAMLAGLLFAGLAPDSGNARTLKTIYDFCSEPNCADGKYPTGPLLKVGATYYGTTARGGQNNFGVAFKLTVEPVSGQPTLTVLHDFCALGGQGCTDGSFPNGALVRDKSGNLYGVTVHGGDPNCPSFGFLGCGTVFGLLYNSADQTYTHHVLYTFCKDGGCNAGGRDGAFPVSGLTLDADGNLYGVAAGLQSNDDYGIVFKLAPKNETRTKWSYKILRDFCSSCADGVGPDGGLVIDNKTGNLYGTASSRGAHDAGIAFALLLNKATGKYSYKVLHDFCAARNCVDGKGPTFSMVLDPQGSLYGTVYAGGARQHGGVFKLTPNAGKTAWAYNVIYSFCASTGCSDGAAPYSNLVMDKNGNLFGVGDTRQGNANGGAIFQLTPNAKKTAYSFKSLKRFCVQTDCADAAVVNGGLLLASDGSLFISVGDRGAHDDNGSIMELVND